MNASILLVALTVSCPWSQTVATYVNEPNTYCLPCTPVTVPTTAATAIASDQLQQVVAESKEADPATAVSETETVTENTSAKDEIVTDPASFSSGGASLGLGHMALDWGLSSIGAGTLYPSVGPGTGGGFAGGGGGPLRGGGGGDNGNGATASSSPGMVVINNFGGDPGCDCDKPDGPGGNTVPEPISISLWAVGLAAMGVARWRRAG